MGHIFFFAEDIDFQVPQKQKLKKWILNVARMENIAIGEINYIFCSDTYLLEMNQKYLQHDYYTDIITFDHSDQPNQLVGDIFISVDRVSENANSLQVPFSQELHRVMIHGVLHLMGYHDKDSTEKELMRQKEDTCLSLLK